MSSLNPRDRKIPRPNLHHVPGENPRRRVQRGDSLRAGERIRLRIEDLAYGGAGVGRHEGMVYFVPETIPGEFVEVEVVRKRSTFREARLIGVLEASPDREKPRCGYFGRCGGCAYQHLRYPVQLEWKFRQVVQLYRRIGRCMEPPVFPVVPSPLEWNYRNRIRVHVRDGRVGFFARGGHRIVDVTRCEIACDSVNAQLARLRRAPGGDRELTLAQRTEIGHFEQTNDFAGELLCTLLEEHLPRDAAVLVDAYAGAGFFGHRLAPRFQSVVGIETHPEAVEKAQSQAAPHERYVHGDVEYALPEVLRDAEGRRVLVLLDPPATGLGQGVVTTLNHLQPDYIVYVSCDAATQARDIRSLLDGGYQLNWLRPLDMFPQTADIEVVALLDKPR